MEDFFYHEGLLMIGTGRREPGANWKRTKNRKERKLRN